MAVPLPHMRVPPGFSWISRPTSHELAMVQNQWYNFGTGAPPILEPILVVGFGCSLGVRFGF